MTIREAIGKIATLDSKGNRPGSDRQSKGFENEVTNILRSVGPVTERPNGSNGYPSFIHNGTDYQIKTAKGNKPMWNEAYVRADSVLILNLKSGTVIVHGSLITTTTMEKILVDAKDYVAEHMRTKFPKKIGDNFFVSGGRTQFGDNIDWAESRKTFMDDTIKILEKK